MVNDYYFCEMESRKSVIVMLLIWMMNSIWLDGQKVPEVISYNNEQYGGAQQNWMFAQDCFDHLFVANTAGVLIYNGYSWRNISILDGKRPRAVFRGNDCKIYVGGFEFFGYISMEDESHPSFVPMDVPDLPNSREEIWNIFGDANKIVFQSFAEVFIYDYKEFKHLKPEENVMLGVCLDGNFYIPKIQRGLYTINADQLEELDWFDGFANGVKVTSMLSRGDEFLITTQHEGMFRKGLDSDLTRLKIGHHEDIAKHEINKAISLKGGGVAIGTISNGVYILDENMVVKYVLNKQNSLTNNTVLSLFEDNKGDLWVGLDKGINQIKLKDNRLLYYDKTGNVGTVFSAVSVDEKMIIGTNQGLFREDTNSAFDMVPGSQGQVWSLIKVGDDLIVGHNNGSYQLEENGVNLVGSQTGGWDMSLLPGNRILQSTYNGFIILHKEMGVWKAGKRVAGTYPPMERFCLTQNNVLGYHIDYGLIFLEFTPGFDSITKVTRIQEINGESVDNQVMFYGNDGGFVVINNEVFYNYDGQHFTIINNPHSQKDKYFMNVISSLGSTYAPHNAFKNLQEKDIVLKVNDDGFELWSDGFTAEACNIVLDYVAINGTSFKWEGKEMDLASDENNLDFFLKKPFVKCVGYEYKLEGWDREWLAVPDDGKLIYRNLRSGEFTLKLRQLRPAKETTLCSLKVADMWYESWQGLVLWSSLFFLSFYIFNWWHKQNLQKETTRLTKEKEQDLERQRILVVNEKMTHDLNYKAKMLANSTMTLVQKNNMLNELKEVLSKEETTDTGRKKWKQKMRHLIDQNLSADEEWEIFEQNFAEVHEDFLERLKNIHPHLTGGEQRLAAYIRMDLSSKEIAPLMNISLRSVENKRYRLRKRLDLEHDDNLSSYLTNL